MKYPMSFLDHFRKKSTDPHSEEGPQHVETRSEAGREGNPGSDEASKEGESDSEERLGKVTGGKSRTTRPPESATSAPPAHAPPGTAGSAPATKPADETAIRFTLGDFLHRIPANLLKPGPHETNFELRFDPSDVADRIARGYTTISLAEVYKRAPHIFRNEIRETDNVEIRFPWQKLMSYVAAESGIERGAGGLSRVAADTLAARLKSRRQEKPPPRSAAEGAPASGTEPARPQKRGAGRQLSWYSKPTEKGAALASTASSSDGKRESKPADPIEIPEFEELHSPPSGALRTSPAPPAIRFTDTDPENWAINESVAKPATPDPALAELTRLNTEQERQIAELVEEKKNATEERDKLLAESEQLRRQLEEKIRHVELQANVASQSGDERAKAESARESLQRALDDQTRVLHELKAQIEETKRSGEEKMNTVAQERDALLQQKNHLSEQLAQVRHPRGGALQNAASESDESTGTPGRPVERSNRQYQRQIDELNRRITAFESSQKEAAHELTKEREARIKVERALAAAERARAEATALVESMRVETRRELETGLRKRESEFARTQQELQEQLDAATAAQTAAVAERTRIAAQLEEEQSKAKAAQEQMQRRVAELEQTLAAARSGQQGEAGWEARAVASLESDIESYRARIKALLQERDDWSKERDTIDGLARERSVAIAERDKLAGEREALLAKLNRIEAEMERVSAEQQRDTHGAELAALRTERDHAEEKWRREKADLESRNAELVEQLAATVREKVTIDAQRQTSAQSERSAIDTAGRHAEELLRIKVEHQRALEAIGEERDQVKTRLTELESKSVAEIAALAAQREETAQERAALAERMATLTREAERTNIELRRECETLQNEKEAAIAELRAAQQLHTTEINASSREFNNALRERDEALTAAQGAEARLEEQAISIARERAELARLEAETKAQLERDAIELRKERDVFLRQRNQLRQRLARLLDDDRELLATTDESAEVEVPTIEVGEESRSTAPRHAKEANVIEISAEERGAEAEGSILLPQVRPVVVRPPQLRVL